MDVLNCDVQLVHECIFLLEHMFLSNQLRIRLSIKLHLLTPI